MPTTPKISVLIPSFNYARFLPMAIESVLAQDFTDFEIIISDDASTDESADVIRRYAAKDSRIRGELHPANLGMVANWNWCLQQARGEYIKYLGGDDCLASRHALGRMAALLSAHPQATLAASARLILDENSEVTELWDELHRPGMHSGPKTIARCLRTNRNLVGEPAAVMFRRGAASRGFDPALRQIVDLEMWFHLLLQGDLVYTPEPLCVFRRHSGQQTAINRESRVGDTEMIQLLTQYLADPAFRSRTGLSSLSYRRVLFRGLHYLRKSASSHPNLKTIPELLQAQLPRRWWMVCWLLHRVTQPFENLRRAIRLRRLRKTVQAATEQLAFLRMLSPAQAAPRILVIRRRYLGDIVLLGSVFRSLRRHWPQAHLAVLVERAYAGVPAMNPAVDDILEMPHGLLAWWRLARTLRREKFTLVLDFDNRRKTALITRLSGAAGRVTLHHGPKVCWPRYYTRHEAVEDDFLVNRHITDYYHRLLRAVDVPLVSEPFLLTPRPADLEFVRQLPELANLPPGRPRLLVHPGSRSPYRVWPAEAFAEVCDRLQTEGTASVILVAGPAEQAIVSAIRQHMRTPVVCLQQTLAVPQLAALFASVDLLLCHDSGPMHLAAAVGTRVVALYGSQNPANWRPLGAHHIVLQPPLP
ncbi:MAG TPA: glycosyltransferase family 9 protein, partial [Opitutaceae bacterium]|nr:glycosyltransferase family 9 protein [Opitutaceae bacterium]